MFTEHQQVVPSSWQHGGPITLASDSGPIADSGGPDYESRGATVTKAASLQSWGPSRFSSDE